MFTFVLHPADIQLANHVIALQCIQVCAAASANKKCFFNLIDFNHCMVLIIGWF